MPLSYGISIAERGLCMFRANDGVLKTQRAMKLGTHPETLNALRDDQVLERRNRGLNRVADGKPLDNPGFVTAALQGPKGVIFLISELAFHRMTAEVPQTVYLAIAASDQAPALRCPPLHLFRYSKATFEDRMTAVEGDGTNICIYPADRTLGDCFKYRNKIGIDGVPRCSLSPDFNPHVAELFDSAAETAIKEYCSGCGTT